jgi:transposase InsO family protein
MRLAHSNLVWATDITYVPLAVGFLYRVAIIDWYSRYLLAWRALQHPRHLLLPEGSGCGSG